MHRYQILCINLERRLDRKESMIKLFELHGITNYSFFKAFDGSKIEPTSPLLNFFKHGEMEMHRQGVAGVALSHYHIWKQLLADDNHDYYVILEDDVRLADNFESKLNVVIPQMNDDVSILFLGITLFAEVRLETMDIYVHNKSLSINPLSNNYRGGAFGYIINKRSAAHLVDYVAQNSMKMVIDIMIVQCGLPIYETWPQLVFADAVQHAGFYVDSDIQRNYDRINFGLVKNNYQFDDYDFYPNQDSLGGDIRQICADIEMVKKIADTTENCVAFNSYGWIKHTIAEPKDFIVLKNHYYDVDGMYVKKSHDINNIRKYNFDRKIRLINDKAQENCIRIFINEYAQLYSSIIVEAITNSYKKFIFVSHDKNPDITINHIMEEVHHTNINALNIIINGEPFNNKTHYDISIDTKRYNPNVFVTVHYPQIFSSIHEYRQSMNPSDHAKPKTKFCAYMYQMIHQHRINYFNLLSKYKKVDGLGKCCRNVNIPETRGVYTLNKTFNDIAVELYSQYKFVLAIENSMIDGYSTEKLLSPIIANSVPIYWGDSYIFKYINKKRVVYALDFSSDDELLTHIIYLDNNDEAYKSIINEPIFVSDVTFESIECELAETIKNVLIGKKMKNKCIVV